MSKRTVQIKTMFVMAAIAAVASVVLSTASAKPQEPPGQPPDAVLVWNTNAVKAVRASTPTKVQTDGMVYMSYVQAAVYDAVTKLEGRYQPTTTSRSRSSQAPPCKPRWRRRPARPSTTTCPTSSRRSMPNTAHTYQR